MSSRERPLNHSLERCQLDQFGVPRPIYRYDLFRRAINDQIADAFAALGLLATLFSSSGRAVSRAKSARSPAQDERRLTEQELRELLHRILEKARAQAQPVEWRFPRADQHLRIGSSFVPLSNLAPVQVADAWLQVIRSSPSPPRLRVTRYPTRDPVIHWFRLLFEAVPPGKAVHIHFDAPLAPPPWEWPANTILE